MANGVAKHVRNPASDSLALLLSQLELLGILNGGQVLLLLVEVVLVDLFLELDVFLVNSVDLFSQVLVLSLESLDELVLVLYLLNLVVVHVGLNLDLVPQRYQLLGLENYLHVVVLLGVARGLALLCLEGALTDLN